MSGQPAGRLVPYLGLLTGWGQHEMPQGPSKKGGMQAVLTSPPCPGTPLLTGRKRRPAESSQIRQVRKAAGGRRMGAGQEAQALMQGWEPQLAQVCVTPGPCVTVTSSGPSPGRAQPQVKLWLLKTDMGGGGPQAREGLQELRNKARTLATQGVAHTWRPKHPQWAHRPMAEWAWRAHGEDRILTPAVARVTWGRSDEQHRSQSEH